MIGSAEILTAFRELSNSKSLGRQELHELLEDGIKAALAKKHGPNVQAEVRIDDDRGTIGITLLKNVVETVEDSGKEVSLEDARFEDPEFQVGDVMEIPVDFTEFMKAVKLLGVFWVAVNEPPPTIAKLETPRPGGVVIAPVK